MSQHLEQVTASAAVPTRSSADRLWPVYATSLLVFSAAAAPVVYFNRSMSPTMLMPGGWTMSMTWMPMGNWIQSAAMFALMWLAMMVAMMLPSTLPVLLLYRRVLRFRGAARVGATCWLLACAYFVVWLGFGLAAYGFGIAIAQLAMHSRAVSCSVPMVAGLALVAAGLYQLTPLKAECLRHCRDPLLLVSQHSIGGWKGAVSLGVHHGAFCVACCWALMLIQLVIGVMNLAAMVAVALVIALEKLVPRGVLVARVVGVITATAGVVLAVGAAVALALKP
jgi:predicted metal-binding membrane protein